MNQDSSSAEVVSPCHIRTPPCVGGEDREMSIADGHLVSGNAKGRLKVFPCSQRTIEDILGFETSVYLAI